MQIKNSDWDDNSQNLTPDIIAYLMKIISIYVYYYKNFKVGMLFMGNFSYDVQ